MSSCGEWWHQIPRILLVTAIMTISMPEVISAYSSSSTPSNSIGWSNAEIEAARINTEREGARIRAVDGILSPRDVHIKAEPYEPGSPHLEQAPNGHSITKIIHLQRHAQGYHNLLGEIMLDAGITPDISVEDLALNPWRRPEVTDSPLTELGKEESLARRYQASALNPQLVVVSPMLRALQTAKISFADHDTQVRNVPWIAHEGCREELGYLYCNKRRPRTHIQNDYPTVDLSLLEGEEDTLFDNDNRECPAEMANRGYRFLVDFVAQRPETEIAIVSHSMFIFNMCTVLLDCTDEYGNEIDDLSSWFKTAEIRSMKLTFTNNNNNDSNFGSANLQQQQQQQMISNMSTGPQMIDFSPKQLYGKAPLRPGVHDLHYGPPSKPHVNQSAKEDIQSKQFGVGSKQLYGNRNSLRPNYRVDNQNQVPPIANDKVASYQSEKADIQTKQFGVGSKQLYSMKPLLRAGGVNEFNRALFDSTNNTGMQSLNNEDSDYQRPQPPSAQEPVPKYRPKSNKLYIRRSLLRGDA